MPSLEQLNSFRVVYDSGSYSAAARILNKDRTTIREHILALEDTIGLTLFTIEGKKAVATELATHLYPKAVHLCMQARNFERSASRYFEQKITELVIPHHDLVPTVMMVSIEQAISRSSPGLEIHWLTRPRQKAMEMLEQGKAHFALYPRIDMAELPWEAGYHELGDLMLSVYARPESCLNWGDPVTFGDLAQERQYLCENQLRDCGDKIRVSPCLHKVSCKHLLIEMIKKSGFAVLNDQDAAPFLERRELVRIPVRQVLQPHHKGLNLYCSQAYAGNPAHGALLEPIKLACQPYLNQPQPRGRKRA